MAKNLPKNLDRRHPKGSSGTFFPLHRHSDLIIYTNSWKYLFSYLHVLLINFLIQINTLLYNWAGLVSVLCGPIPAQDFLALGWAEVYIFFKKLLTKTEHELSLKPDWVSRPGGKGEWRGGREIGWREGGRYLEGERTENRGGRGRSGWRERERAWAVPSIDGTQPIISSGSIFGSKHSLDCIRPGPLPDPKLTQVDTLHTGPAHF